MTQLGALLLHPPQRSARRIALTVAVTFGIFGMMWVLLTDVLLYSLAQDDALVARFEIAKGWTFVALTAGLLYLVTLRSASRFAHAQGAISAIVDSIADGVLLLGPERTIVHANPGALRMLGCERPSELVGMGAAEFSRRFRVSYPSGALVPPGRFVSQRVFDEGGQLHYKAVLHVGDGPELVIRVTAAAVCTRPGAPTELVVSVLHDVTDSESLERLYDQFFAGAAHALKTPVAVIKANAAVVSRDSAQKVRRSAAAIERQCARIDRLVQNLLVVARARSKSLTLHPAELTLRPLVERVANEMATAAPRHDLRTELMASPRVHADAERLALVLRNLVSDAIRASPSGAPLTLLLDARGAEAQIGVRHQSIPVYERTQDASGEYDDSTLGRCATTTIVEAHGGTLLEDDGDAESTTWLRLPAIAEAA